VLPHLNGDVPIPMDYKQLKRPPQISEEVWRQHLHWMEVVGKQLDENIAKRRKQLARERDPEQDDTGGDAARG
jgi:hypothetical protein